MALGHHTKRPAPSLATLSVLSDVLASLKITSSKPMVRYASHQAQGRANGAKDGPGKRLGAKKSGGEYVIPGNILFKQRGTLWFPGENASMGRDHTIHAAAPGWVRYYRDPARHPKRKFIGIALEKEYHLPTPPNAVRRRKLGMLAYRMPSTITEQGSADLVTGADTGLGGNVEMGDAQPSTIREMPNSARVSNVTIHNNPQLGEGKQPIEHALTLRPGYQYRQANWYIGRAAERSKEAQKVASFRPRDRFAAWRKSVARKTKNAERRAMGRGRGGKKK